MEIPEKTKKTVCVMGLGYVGLPTAAILTRHGYRVAGVDINKSVVETINHGKIHIAEEGLDELVSGSVGTGLLTAALEPSAANIFLITVPTPLKDDFIPNIDHVLAAAHALAPHVRPGNLIILESTSPVGTTEKVAAQLAECGVPLDDIDIAYCPERILPGNTLSELIENSRIIGGLTPRASQSAREFYASFVTGELIVTDARTAEMAKLVENAYRNVNIAFANELSMICDESGLNVWNVIECANKHPRVNILKPGPGVGGHCVAVDPLFISHAARDEAKLISAAHHRNTEKTKWVVDKIRKAAFEFTRVNHRAPSIACLGLSYKPNSDDIRESPALSIVRQLIREGYDVFCVDPHITRALEFYITNTAPSLETGDIIVCLVAHDVFKKVSFPQGAQILDFCGLTER